MSTDTTTPASTVTVAYFSMEIGLDPNMPTYAGGLGILSGDTLKAGADLGAPMVGISLVYRKGYFKQRLDAKGNQTELPVEWSPETKLEEMQPRVTISIEGRRVLLRAWRYVIKGARGNSVPVYFLDTMLPENTPWDQTLTDCLYGQDDHYRLCQETALGIGGIAMLRALGYQQVWVYHINEGHSALLSLALLEEKIGKQSLVTAATPYIDTVRRQCIFTTHTCVPAGHDVFPISMVNYVLGPERAKFLQQCGCGTDSTLGMTSMALFFSRYVNGVSMKHEEVSQGLYPLCPINAVTNGVHTETWTSKPFKDLFDQRMPEWRFDPRYLRYAIGLSLDSIRQARIRAKRDLITEVEKRCGEQLDPNVMTIGFARRATAYKRHDMLFTDLDRLRRMAKQVGPVQVVLAGKAHPRDEGGKALIRRIFDAAAALAGTIKVAYLEDYDFDLARYLVSGVDLWLNTPLLPHEASGSSGMKAALNGVPSLSTLDGWWIEGHIEGVTGWAIESGNSNQPDQKQEIASMYDKLEYVILPMYYNRPDAYAAVMRAAIAINGSFFNAQRMVSQYMDNAYGLPQRY